jgi:hypothetical protein
MWRGTPVAAACALGCGGRIITLPSGDGEATPTAPSPLGEPPAVAASLLRLGKVVARQHGWCGLAQGSADLLCVAGDQVLEQRAGPYLDLDLSDAPDWSYRCAVRGDGELECEGAELELPHGPFSRVSVGLYGACARGEGTPVCWSAVGLPQLDGVEQINGRLSLQAGNLCWGADFRYECRGPAGERWLPSGGHYFDAVATRDGACAAIFPPPDAVDSGDAFTDALLGTAQIACFSSGGVQSKALGLFGVFDVDADGDGCGQESRTGTPVCWGRFQNARPSSPQSSYSQISVSGNQVCWLAWDGSVECTRAASEWK